MKNSYFQKVYDYKYKDLEKANKHIVYYNNRWLNNEKIEPFGTIEKLKFKADNSFQKYDRCIEVVKYTPPESRENPKRELFYFEDHGAVAVLTKEIIYTSPRNCNLIIDYEHLLYLARLYDEYLVDKSDEIKDKMIAVEEDLYLYKSKLDRFSDMARDLLFAERNVAERKKAAEEALIEKAKQAEDKEELAKVFEEITPSKKLDPEIKKQKDIIFKKKKDE